MKYSQNGIYRCMYDVMMHISIFNVGKCDHINYKKYCNHTKMPIFYDLI